jgi:hypothetical protein
MIEDTENKSANHIQLTMMMMMMMMMTTTTTTKSKTYL